ncbi:MAG: DUF5050 domain-containing protein [Eubacterium sp.]|nr:DUF5050 domain-containing protein [Eubacterium sp.]
MTPEKLSKAVGNISDGYITEAEQYRAPARSKKSFFVKFAAAAACVCAVCVGAVALYAVMPGEKIIYQDPNYGTEYHPDARPLCDNSLWWTPAGGSISSDGKYLEFGNDKYKLDIQEYVIADACLRENCDHIGAKCERGEYHLRKNYYDGGFFYISPVSGFLMYYKDGRYEAIYQNSYVSDYESANYDVTNTIVHYFLTDDGIICFGVNYAFKIGYDGELICEPVEWGDGYGLSMALIDNNRVLVGDINNTLSVVDLKAGTLASIAHNAIYGSYVGGKIYYLDNSKYPEPFRLTRCDLNGENTETLLNDCYPYCYSDEYIFFMTEKDDCSLYRYNVSSAEIEKILDTRDVSQQLSSDGLYPDSIYGLRLMGTINYLPKSQKLVLELIRRDPHNGYSYECPDLLILDKNGENPVFIKGK